MRNTAAELFPIDESTRMPALLTLGLIRLRQGVGAIPSLISQTENSGRLTLRCCHQLPATWENPGPEGTG